MVLTDNLATPNPLDAALPHSRWQARGIREVDRVRRALGAACHAVHHIGSTSLPSVTSVPGPAAAAPVPAVMDLLAELHAPVLPASILLRLLAHGFTPAPAAAPCTLHIVDDALTGHRRVELLCYPAGHAEAQFLIAFFAHIRVTPVTAAAYDRMKRDARARHGPASPAYAATKRAWMQQAVPP